MRTLKILLVVSLISLVSCKKELAKLEGKTCWKCHVVGYPEALNPNDKPYDKTVCLKDGEVPGVFKDDYGNDVNSTCTKQ